MAQDAERDVTEETRAAERREAVVGHDADRPPTEDEERAAGRHGADPAVAAHEKEMGRIGATVGGEGEIA